MKRTPFLVILSVVFTFACEKKQETQEKKDTATIDSAKVKKSDGPELVWSTDTTLKTCESVLFDKGRNILYVSSIDGDPLTKDNNGFISIVNPDGKIHMHKFATGLNAPKGMGIANGKLYVTDISDLVEIDTESGKILKRYPVAGAKFLNDIAVSEEGDLYFSDSETGKIHRFAKGKVELWKDGFKGPNGLYVLGGNLYLSSMGSADFRVINMQTKKGSVVATEVGAGDGVEYTENGADFLVSDWNGQVFLIKGDGSKTKLIDTRDKKLSTADIEYIAEQRLLLVPTFGGNRVDAYQLAKD